jgi:hypothetical protein
MKRLGYLSLITLVVTAIWLILLIAGTASAGPLDTFERVLVYVSRLDALFYLTYLNAALIVVAATALFCDLYRRYREAAPDWTLVGLIFVPVYAAFNLFAYLSQIGIVPSLVALRQRPEYQAAADLLLRQVIQQWPESGVAFFNALAYAVLGIPSIVFRLLMFREKSPLKAAGALLALNGVACILGIVGFLARSAPLSLRTLAGGVLFLLALVPMSLMILKEVA